MRLCIKAANGIFWYIDDSQKLLSYPFESVDSTDGIAKSGHTYNHKKFWKEFNMSNKPYNYYPRGRVDWTD